MILGYPRIATWRRTRDQAIRPPAHGSGGGRSRARDCAGAIAVAANGAEATGDLRVSPTVVIPANELEVSFHTTGGPGGQHANRSATGVTLVWDYEASTVLDDSQRALLASQLGNRARGGTLRVVADNSRSQWRNRSRARAQLAELVRTGLARPPARRATKPSRSARRRRLSNKRHRSETKRLRRRPDVD